MYEVFIGNYERLIGTVAFYRKGNKYIPCKVTNYYFKSRKYALVDVDKNLYYTTKPYVIA